MNRSYDAAMGWMRANSLDERGIAYSTLIPVPYQLVTGCLIPTLFDAGDNARALAYADFLSWVQRPSGAFAGIDGKEYVFDTAQALRGLLAAGMRDARYLDSARRAAAYIAAGVGPSGEIASPYGKEIPGAVHLYALAPLAQASRVLGVSAWHDATQRSLEFYLTQAATFDPSALTHYSAYIVDGAMEMEATRDVSEFARRVLHHQRADGSIAAYPGRVRWVCLSGVAQWAVIASKLGMAPQAGAALKYLEKVQEISGGFKGSLGYGASYFPNDEVSWAVKFFMDAVHAVSADKPALFTAGQKGLSPEEWHTAITGGIDPEEFAQKLRSGDIPVWCRPLLERTRPGETVLELGSGAGELSAVMALYGRKVRLLDISSENLSYARRLFLALGLEADCIETDALKGIPLADGSVDWVCSSGLLEHFNDTEVLALMQESKRVCRRGVVSLVPNAASLPYRAGRAAMERNGSWAWGVERPARSMRPVFEQTGLSGIVEQTVAPVHALCFCSMMGPVRALYETLPPDELASLGQGYLLVTYGTR